jgi:hypothetical protein
MAKKNSKNRIAENTKPAAKRQTSAPPTPAQGTADTGTELEIANPGKTKGSVQYRLPGVAGSVRVARGLFGGEPPARLIVLGPFAQPDPEKAARARESTEQKAAKLEARIARAKATAEKSTQRLAKLRATLEVK